MYKKYSPEQYDNMFETVISMWSSHSTKEISDALKVDEGYIGCLVMDLRKAGLKLPKKSSTTYKRESLRKMVEKYQGKL